ncbi:MAG: UDP-N-acetylmuramate--L-alanine ligase [Anaerolineales bacterium]|nr:UDP-N-acetylmuramate--L-alanine ligase [Anaerolineales bacterium]MCB9127950.1 UDP-N-acetylmuramate--L-alanine ligase [Ardenticatenales bacterium]MCB9171712.1 UDP-N-acetylmuramate--L-alanine ligase [Ardenticatenales bacterium]
MNKQIHFIGIGGSGLSALAQVMLARGWRVSGSDRERSTRTARLERLGATIYERHERSHVAGADVVVISSAIPSDNVERRAALEMGIPVMKREQWLAEMTQESELIAVAGTHGKSTTTAMVALMLLNAGLDPTVVIGATLPQIEGNARAGNSHLFVIEADEYDFAFLGLKPEIAVVLNIEHDHPDMFEDDLAVQDAFHRFISQLSPAGTLIACGDDAGVQRLLDNLSPRGRVVRYGFGEGLEWRAAGRKRNDLGGIDFVALHDAVPIGAFRLAVPGHHNVLNALAAIAVGDVLGIDTATMQASLTAFTGVNRRFEAVGAVGTIQIYDDYAHHPTEIRATLQAARQRFGRRPLWVVFQPHTFSRLSALYEDFLTAFAEADHVVVSDVFAARESGDSAAQSRQLAREIVGTDAHYRATQAQIVDYLLAALPERAVVLTLGAGDITSLGPRLRNALEDRLALESGEPV